MFYLKLLLLSQRIIINDVEKIHTSIHVQRIQFEFHGRESTRCSCSALRKLLSHTQYDESRVQQHHIRSMKK